MVSRSIIRNKILWYLLLGAFYLSQRENLPIQKRLRTDVNKNTVKKPAGGFLSDYLIPFREAGSWPHQGLLYKFLIFYLFFSFLFFSLFWSLLVSHGSG